MVRCSHGEMQGSIALEVLHAAVAASSEQQPENLSRAMLARRPAGSVVDRSAAEFVAGVRVGALVQQARHFLLVLRFFGASYRGPQPRVVLGRRV